MRIILSSFLFLFAFIVTTPALSNNDTLRIEADELRNNLEKYAILDVRSPSNYTKMHIDGALNFPANWTYENKQIDGKVIQPNRIQLVLRHLGIDLNTPVVVYDDGALVNAARVFWTLEVYGLKNVRVLNAGFDTWTKLDYPVSVEKPQNIQPSRYIPVVNQKRIATKLTTQIATKNPNQIIIDARPTSMYNGEESSAKRYGHIPKAINIPASHNFEKDQDLAKIQPVDKLKEIYASIPKGKKVVAYCAIGRISSANYLALRELGYDVAVYDASWREWGNDFALPIVAPKASSQ